MSNSIAEEFDRNHEMINEWQALNDIGTQLNTIANACNGTPAVLIGIMDALRSISVDVCHFTRSSPEVLRLKIELFDKLEDLLDDEQRKKAALQLMRAAGFEL